MWTQMGFMRWPLTFSLVVVLALCAYSAVKLYGPRAEADERAKAWLDAILFWGGFAMVAGVLGTLVGLAITAASLEQANGGPAGLMWGGVKVALSTSIFGTLILAGASLAWFALQLRWRLLVAQVAG